MRSSDALALFFCGVWLFRTDLGVSVLSMVPRQSAGAQGRECSRGGFIADGRGSRRRPCASSVEEAIYVSVGLVSLRPVFRSELLVVLFHYVVSNIFAAGAGIQHEAKRVDGGNAPFVWRFRGVAGGLDFTVRQSLAWQRQENPLRFRRGRFPRGRKPASPFDTFAKPILGSGCHF